MPASPWKSGLKKSGLKEASSRSIGKYERFISIKEILERYVDS